MRSFLQKLTLLFFSTLLVVGVVAHSLWNVYEAQSRIKQEILVVSQTRSHLEQLRTQLSLFLQYKDQESFEQLFSAQKRLEIHIQQTAAFSHVMKNLERMSKTFQDLLNHEQSLQAVNDTTKELIHSRYNMIVMSMDEELSSLQRTVLEKRLGQLTEVVFNSGLSLVFFTLLVSLITLVILKRFKKGCETLQQGFNELSQGDLNSHIKPKGIDQEFVVVAEHFNEMKTSLSQITVTREQLELEVFRQTAELREQKEQLVYLSESDPLTGLKNRRAFLTAVDEATMKANRSGLKLALLFVDLNKFKEVNDTYGHDAGDAVLCAIAERMKTCFRASDILGRLGGDEFVICLDLLKDYSGVMHKTEQFAEMVSQPITFNGQTLTVSASVGISCYPDQTSSIAELVKLADEDMYRAKNDIAGGIVSRFLNVSSKFACVK
ncbi:diguanylate cyclase [Vibrio sp. IRLE0018]|uniref:putative bifunctional diguanylate cyclase/phosphodiesterase n=1 Tax=Vibrio floridensis TaxID=2908007 RepID=UPI001F1B13FF|nr:diguanylate cyclase [Vibrio floridensis]MCF8778293.1 diguanylate cyclase [Vibrio floridensis]